MREPWTENSSVLVQTGICFQFFVWKRSFWQMWGLEMLFPSDVVGVIEDKPYLYTSHHCFVSCPVWTIGTYQIINSMKLLVNFAKSLVVWCAHLFCTYKMMNTSSSTFNYLCYGISSISGSLFVTISTQFFFLILVHVDLFVSERTL